MMKPTDQNTSWTPGIGQAINDAGVHGNIIHNVTQHPLTGRPVFWFQKVKGQRNMGVAQWLLDVLTPIGSVYLVDFDSSGKNPIAIRRVGSMQDSSPIDREWLLAHIKRNGIPK